MTATRTGLIVAVPAAEPAVAAHRFALTLDRIAWFGDTVVWLGPEPGGTWRPIADFPLG